MKRATDGDIAALLTICEKLRHPRKIALYRLVIATLAYTEARTRELLNLQVEHVDPERKMLTIHAGKGNKTGHLYPCDEWWQAYRYALLSATLEYALELGGDAKAMATLGSLNSAARTAAGAPAVPQVVPEVVSFSKHGGADSGTPEGTPRQMSRAEQVHLMRRRAAR